MARYNAALTILVLEDDADLREALEFAFSQYDLKCLPAGSVEEAIDLIGREKIDAIVSDVNLPGRSGLEFLKHVRTDDSRTPFFLMSGAVDMTAKVATELGASGFIEKPFVDLRFARKIKAAIDLSQAAADETVAS